jgi:hypothetical protein
MRAISARLVKKNRVFFNQKLRASTVGGNFEKIGSFCASCTRIETQWRALFYFEILHF